jgi:hypothetical protein
MSRKVKGQIFSLDFIIAIVIVIVFFGTILNAYETRNIMFKQEIENQFIIEKSNNAFLLLTSNFPCETKNGVVLPHTINVEKMNDFLGDESVYELKRKINLENNNVILRINGNKIVDEGQLNKKTIVVIEKDILTCSNTIDFEEFEKCLTGGNCDYIEQKISLMVSK